MRSTCVLPIHLAVCLTCVWDLIKIYDIIPDYVECHQVAELMSCHTMWYFIPF